MFEISIQMKIVELVAQSGRKGTTAALLAKETGKLIPDVRKYLADNKRYFCRIGGSKYYRLNPFGEIKANPEKILAELKQQKSDEELLLSQLLF